MNGYCVVVAAAGGRARLFTLEPARYPEVESGPNLVEQQDLVDPERESSGQELWANAKSGRNRAPGGGPAHGYDDHREQHRDESERRFARQVAQEAVRLAREQAARTIVLAAEKRMLGFMREALDSLAREGVAVRELAKDLSKLPPLDLHEHLAREGLVPARRNPVT
jgi:protein required for attachment to host cells